MNPFDATIIEFLNQFAQISRLSDSTIKVISENHLIKGAFLITILWWAWFRVNKDQTRVQIHLVATLISCFIAIAAARSLALMLPFRLRPMHEDNIDFMLPYGMDPVMLDGWSSFPSDHALLFYALSTGMFYISKKFGTFALLYTTLFIGLPRIYLGLHYPTDILAGAFIGITITVLCNSNFVVDKIRNPIQNWSKSNPQYFYPVFFFITYQIADMFNNSRALLGLMKSIFQSIFI